jgi:hypothetical protein
MILYGAGFRVVQRQGLSSLRTDRARVQDRRNRENSNTGDALLHRAS